MIHNCRQTRNRALSRHAPRAVTGLPEHWKRRRSGGFSRESVTRHAERAYDIGCKLAKIGKIGEAGTHWERSLACPRLN